MARHRHQTPETRAAILKTAQRLFMEVGYRAVSTRQIADACGLTQPALYHHFADKESLYVEVLRSVCEESRTVIERILKREKGIRERLSQIAAFLMTHHPEDLSTMFHDIRHELSEASQETLFRSWHGAYLAPLIGVFEEGQRSGELRPPGPSGADAAMSARLLMGLVSQTVSMQNAAPVAAFGRAPGKKRPLEQQAAMLVDVMLYGLAAPAPVRGAEAGGDGRQAGGDPARDRE